MSYCKLSVYKEELLSSFLCNFLKPFYDDDDYFMEIIKQSIIDGLLEKGLLRITGKTFQELRLPSNQSIIDKIELNQE